MPKCGSEKLRTQSLKKSEFKICVGVDGWRGKAPTILKCVSIFQWEFDILHFASFFTASVCVCVGGWRDRAPTSFISALLSPSLPVLIREPARQVLRRQVLRLTWSKWVGEPDYFDDTGQVWGKKWEIWGATELLEGLHLWHPLSKERIRRSWAEKNQQV